MWGLFSRICLKRESSKTYPHTKITIYTVHRYFKIKPSVSSSSTQCGSAVYYLQKIQSQERDIALYDNSFHTGRYQWSTVYYLQKIESREILHCMTTASTLVNINGPQYITYRKYRVKREILHCMTTASTLVNINGRW